MAYTNGGMILLVAEVTNVAALRVIAQQAREKRRMKPANLDRIILQLCRNRYLTRQEIAEVVQRNPDGLHTRNIKPMTDKGLLRMRHPDRPNRVDHAYQTVEESS